MKNPYTVRNYVLTHTHRFPVARLTKNYVGDAKQPNRIRSGTLVLDEIYTHDF